MTRTVGIKAKKARRVGEALRDKDAKVLVKRNYPPGMHGQSRKRISEYGIQLLEKQKAKWTYHLSESQFRKYYKNAEKKKGLTPKLLLEFLELRLDNVVYRLGFAESRTQARQLVSHKFITVNGKKINIPSCHVSIGDTVGISDNKKTTKYIQTLSAKIKDFKPQEWLQVDKKSLTGKILTNPTFDNTGNRLRMQLIAEHYNR